MRLVARGGRVRKTLNKYLFREPLVAEYGSVDELGLRLEYLAMRPGEVFVLVVPRILFHLVGRVGVLLDFRWTNSCLLSRLCVV